MDRWSEGHLALFEALSEICDRVGDDDARDLAQSIKKPNGATFIQGLRELQQKADIADIITKDSHSADIHLAFNEPKVFAKQLQELKWKAQILDTLHTDDSDAASSHAIADPEVKELAVRLQSLREKAQLYDEINGTSKPDTSDIQSRLKDALSVRKELISRLRRVRENRTQWIQYAHSLSKRLEKREATLAEHGLLNGIPFQKGSGMERYTTSEPEIISKEPRSTDPSRVTPELAPPRPNLSLNLPGTTDDNDLDGDTMVATPSTKTPKPATLAHVLGEPQSVIKAIPESEKPTSTHTDPRGSSGQPAQLDQFQTAAVTVDEQHQLPRLAPIREASLERDAAANNLLASSQEHHTSSTQGEADDTVIDLPTGLDNHPAVTPSSKYQVEPSSDAPVVVSTRAIRKRKAKSSPQKVKIKREIELSSPVALLGISTLEPQESLDLDEIGQKTITPKKKRRVHDPGFSFPGDDDTEMDYYHYKHPPAFNESIVRSPILGEPSTPHINSRQEARRVVALQPKSSNKLILPRTSAKYTPVKRLRHAEAPGEVPFAEDGENESRVVATAQNRGGKTHTCQRLSSLLNTTSPNSSLLQTPNNISNKRTPRTAGSSHRSTAERDKRRAAKRIESFRDASDCPDDEPFRARPLWRLGLEHFKVNPDHNQGYYYAFRDVVRGREQRKCLPGCTNPECCGNGFRKLAELTTGQAKNQSSDRNTEDELLLEDFLGGNIHKLQAMSADERQETLIQAKARDLANKHGKHRHAFERRQSPPGFWRADFPTTQEVQSDRAEAADFERELVRKRYEDAVRGGGKWMFRDE
ncbi:hypothetical protein V500_00439 [Pseudogymnoascus sp. VKM F-4518 (FW-2643)]|nr:hypothetical protein V500_00439 [Pseudogymnoascus sp. VKM F-4518 (FW-2643)]